MSSIADTIGRGVFIIGLIAAVLILAAFAMIIWGRRPK